MNVAWLNHSLIFLTVWAVMLSNGCRSEHGGGSREVREKKALALVDHVIAGSFDEARADFNWLMSVSLSAGKLEQVWKSLAAQVGEFEKRTQTRHTVHQGYDVVFVGLKFEKAQLQAKVVFGSGDKVTGLFFQPAIPPWKAPDYAGPDTFGESEISFGLPGWKLKGTLTLPKAVTNPPVVVLVHGSGPHDRDETIGPNKVFKDLAWGLATQGVAVFRYEKRTKVHAGKLAQANKFTMKEETVDDAVAAVAMLRKRNEVDPDRIYVVGHSQGGYCAPRIALHAPIAGFVSVAGNSRPLEELVIEQTEYLMKINPAQATDLKAMRLAAEQIKKLDASDAHSRKVLLGAPISYWFDLRDYDPVAASKEFQGRILAIHASRDYQVTGKDFHRWTNGLAGHEGFTARTFTNLNHLMIPGTGRSKPSEYQQPGHVAEAVIHAIAKWITQ